MRIALLFTITLLTITGAFSQTDTTEKKFFNRLDADDSTNIGNQDAVYRRPFIGFGDSRTAVGGYLEGNTNYFVEDGIPEGFSMEMRRFNIFLYSEISKRIRFLSELEFEHGTQEIALESAFLDFAFNDQLNFRGGVLLPQIGIFNANHDSPVWEFIERPLSSTFIIPSTLSEIGFGLYGKYYFGTTIFSYDAYLVNGLQDEIILNKEGRTFIPAGKGEGLVAVDNNGSPSLNARVAVANRKIGELGLSWYGGIYNKFRSEGELIDEKRWLNMVALDYRAIIDKLQLLGEIVYATIEIPTDLAEITGDKQAGGFFEAQYPVKTFKVFGYDAAKLITSLRVEYVDFNIGEFSDTGYKIKDDIKAIALGFSFRPTPVTVFRLNYRYHWSQDLLGNTPAKRSGIQFGFASYF